MPENLAPRSLRLEPFEERLLLSVNGPSLVAIIPSEGTVITPNQVVHVAPRELTLRFDANIDANTLTTNNVASIQFSRGGDHILGNNNDVTIKPGYYAIGLSPNEVIARFDQSLPDDSYQVRIVGAGAGSLKGTDGKAFNGGTNLTQSFSIDLGAQVVAVVPQPVSRDVNGKLTQATTAIDVYFNVNDVLNEASAETKSFYELIRTSGTATTQDDLRFNPTSVTYNAATGLARLIFDAADVTTAGTYRLRIGNADPLALSPTTPAGAGSPGTSFATSSNLGTLFNASQGTQTVKMTGNIVSVATGVVYPGSPAEPGERDTQIENHVMGGQGSSVTEYAYNFQSEYGSVLGQTVFNLITEPQKQRVREVFSYFAHYLGVVFVETPSTGFTIATGDVRAVAPDLPPGGIGGIAGGATAVMNSIVNWGSSEPGGGYFGTAMHEIGHLLGLGHNYEAPSITIMGGAEDIDGSISGEPVFPGDLDLIYGQYLHPALGNDIDVYKFTLPRAGQLNVETFAERLRQLDPALDPSQLDSVITLYDANGKIISRNDDYYGNDAFVQMALGAGVYYVAITSTGNTNFDPTISGTGFGGTTVGNYELRMSFTPTVADGIKDTTGTLLDGNGDGLPGGAYNFWFKVDAAHTLFVDKAATGGVGALGSITNPYTSISAALAGATPGSIVRIEGNGGTDNKPETVGNNLSYNVGFDSLNRPLSDGTKFEVPRGVTVMVDAGAIIKLRGANVDVGSSAQGIDRSAGALQILGVPTGILNELKEDVGTVYFTSYYNNAIGTDPGTAKATLAKGGWGGLVFRDDSDLEANGIFLNYINHANLSYGGGQVTVNSVLGVFAPIHLIAARPTISYNVISNSADSAISADPNSFEESEFWGIAYHADYTRVGPNVHANTLLNNSINALFVRIRTENGQSLDPLTVSARFVNTDIVYAINEVLLIKGSVGGLYTDATGRRTARPNARLAIDPGVVVKMSGARIETEFNAQFIAEGTTANPVIFTSTFDDRFGAGGNSDTSNDGGNSTPIKGNWGGFFFGPLSIGSLDHAFIAFAGGTNTIEGGFDKFNPIEIHQAQVRVVNSELDNNAGGGGGLRAGRQTSDVSAIFIRGAQPVILNNTIQNSTGAAISTNVNSLNSMLVSDWGRSRGAIDIQGAYITNSGPLIRNNRIGNDDLNGMMVRGGTLTTAGVWDDTDIVHIVQDSIIAPNQQSLTGSLRLQSSPTQSLVVKLQGTNTRILATGTPLDIPDRVGGTVQLIGTPGHPVVLTSLKDDTVGAGLTPDGATQKDTRNTKGVIPPAPQNLSTQGPVILHSAPLDEHGTRVDGRIVDGWVGLAALVDYVFQASRATVPNGNERLLLVVGLYDDPALGVPFAKEAISAICSRLQLTPVFVFGNSLAAVNFSDYKMVYIPSDWTTPLPSFRADFSETNWFGGIDDFDMQTLINRKAELIDYINNKGGGLLALSEAGSEKPYAYLAEGAPIVIERSGGNVITPTANAPAEWNTQAYGLGPSVINDNLLALGLPWLFNFKGSTGFNRMQPLAVDPITGEYAMIGLAPGGPGIGPAQDVARGGDWDSLTLDTYSNDRNVVLVNEVEQGFTSTGDTNGSPTTGQFLGELAKDLKSGDDNVRLGFEIHGGITQATTSPGGGDVDVYSFRGTGGTAVWFDIDRTSSSLDTVIELIDANGALIARSDNSLTETADPGIGIARPLRSGFSGSAGPFTSQDFYSTNPLDAGMRLSLPGAPGTVSTYFVRVRASSGNLANPTAGLTKGAYVLQIRLQDTDEFTGSTVQYADIRYAINAVEVIGKPEHSPLIANTAESSGPHTFIPGFPVSSQDLGNLLTSDRNSLSVAGNLSAAGEVDLYRFEINYDLIQKITGVSDGAKTFATMFQINYADGLARPDTTISIYDATGKLLLTGLDSDIADSLQRPNTGADMTNLGHGSFGTLDPTIGPVQMPAGAPGGTVAYYVAVSSGRTLPLAQTVTLQQNPLNPLIRLEPVDSIRRVVEDHIGFSGGQTAGASQAIFPGNGPSALNVFANPYQLGDVTLFVNTKSGLSSVNPFTGGLISQIGSMSNFYDIAMRNDGSLFSLTQGDTADNSGNYRQISTADAAILSSQDDGITTHAIDDAGPDNPPIGPYFFDDGPGHGIQFEALAFKQADQTSFAQTSVPRRLYAIGNRDPLDLGGNFTLTPPVLSVAETRNILFELDPNTGQAKHPSTQGAVWNPAVNRGGGSGTNYIPIGTFPAVVAGKVTGLAFVGDRLFAVTDVGGFYEVGGFDVQQANDSITVTPLANFGGVKFSGLTVGPQHVEGGRYANTLFATDDTGRIYALDTSGNLKPVFLNGATSVATGISNLKGLAFSTLDYNLWHYSLSRNTDAGHGITPTFNNNGLRDPGYLFADKSILTGSQSNASFYFGLSQPTQGSSAYDQPGAFNYNQGNSAVYNSYSLPGGARGSLTSNSFDLAGYSSGDSPTLYFNYLLNTIDRNSNNESGNNPALDSLRVFASTDGVNWELLATNNVVLNNSASETPKTLTVSGGAYKSGQDAKQKVQPLWDTPLDPLGNPIQAPVWRQARVDLGDYAGTSNIRLRFDFSTAGSMGSGNSLSGTGSLLKALPGAKLNDGSTFAIDNKTFEFNKTGGVAGGNIAVVITDAMTSAQVAAAMAAALDVAFTTGIDDPTNFTSSKLDGDMLRIFGHTIVSSGPLASSSGPLTGDNHGSFTNKLQDRTQQQFEGVYIDDIVIGLAGRGEMVSGAEPTDSSFVSIPKIIPGPAEILTGPYQLSIRAGQSYGAVLESDPENHLFLFNSFDVRDRFTQAFTLVAPPASQISDGQTFAIDDGTTRLTFEFDFNGALQNPQSGYRLVSLSAGDQAGVVASKIAAAINLAVSSAGFKVRAAARSNGTRVDLFDAIAVNAGTLTLLTFNFDGGGDVNLIPDQGQVVVQGAVVSNARQVGIQVIPKFGPIVDTVIAFTENGVFPLGSAGYNPAVSGLPILNTPGWMPGITVKNDLVVNAGRTGIQIGGNPNAPNSYSHNRLLDFDKGNNLGDLTLFVPFARVINNTVFNARVGIAAANAASPTIVNNVIANSGVATTAVILFAGAAIFADNASASTVAGNNVFQGNANNLIGTGDIAQTVLPVNSPLFVDATKGNFYLKQNSLAIDSSVNSLSDRFELTAVTSPLGIPPSPIQAPEFDLLGQLRVDDPSVPSPPGTGSNVFKDRGAVERADFVGPTAVLVNPVDNDAGGIDRNPGINQLILVNRVLQSFSIQLQDSLGVNIDDSTVDVTKFAISQKIGNVTTNLVPGVDYSLAFDSSSKTAQLVPAQGVWPNAIYTIVLDNSLNPIKDLANNTLQPNDQTGATQFVIELTDHFVSPWQNPTNRLDVNANGAVTGLDALLVINRLLLGQTGPLPIVATVPPYIDVNGDGSLSAFDALLVINYLTTTPSAASLVTTTDTAAAPASVVSTDTIETVSTPAPASSGDTNAVAVGLAISQWSASDGDSQAASDASSAPTSSVALPSVTLATSPLGSSAAAECLVDDAFGSDSELDEILDELTQETTAEGVLVR